jgi:hypothetical protein
MADIYWEAIPLLIGFIIEYVLYTKYKFRAGGVVVIPLLAIYTVKYPLMAVALIGLSMITLLIIEILYSKFVVYGRRLLYMSLTAGIILTLIIMPMLDSALGWYSVVVPGLLAYNFHRENHSIVDRARSVIINGATYLLLIGVSFCSLYFL